MCTHSASDRIDIRQRDACMPQTYRLLHEFLGMACTREERMIALDKQFAPLDIPWPACARKRYGGSVGRIMASISAAAQRRMKHMLWWRLIGHRLALNVVVLNANEGGREPRATDKNCVFHARIRLEWD